MFYTLFELSLVIKLLVSSDLLPKKSQQGGMFFHIKIIVPSGCTLGMESLFFVPIFYMCKIEIVLMHYPLPYISST